MHAQIQQYADFDIMNNCVLLYLQLITSLKRFSLLLSQMGFPQVELPEVMLKHTPTYLWEYVGQQKPNGKEGRRKKKEGWRKRR